jgi:hypothetical protein
MSNLTTRAGKGSPLTNNELDANFTNLNADKVEVGGDLSGTSSAPNVAKIQGRAVSTDAPAAGEKLVWSGTAWEPSVDPTGEPIGHADKTQSAISFNSGTRTFTIAPVASEFVVWCKGVKYTYTSAQTVVIPNTTGLHYIYFSSSGVLSTQMSFFSWAEHAPTAYIYWNATTSTAVYFGDERHGVVLDWQTHEYLHRTRGAAIANGFLASGYTLNNSATNAATQIAIESGTFFDEDMKIDIVSTATPTAGTYQQNLLFPAKIPVLHLQGTSWVMDAPTDFPFKQGTSRPQYNSVSGGVWSTADVGNNQHATTWILATNNLTYPVIAIIGQSATDNLGEAEAFSFADLTLIGFPSVEFRPLYKLIYKASNGYANSVNAQLVSIIDLRSISAVGSAANPATDHGNLSGLSDDDHPQYVHTSEVRTPSAAVKNSFFPSQVGQTGKFLSTDGTNTVWEPPPSGSLSFTGDVTGSGSTGSSVAMTLAASGVVAGQYTKVTVDSKGRVTAGTGVTSADVTSALGYTPYNATNPAGYTTNVGTVTSVSGTGTVSGLTLTGSVTSSGSLTLGGTLTLTSGQVTTALGYTPYNATNPSGYISGNQAITVSGDASGSGATSIALTLANSGVSAGTYTKVTVDAKGRVTSATTLAAGDVPTLNQNTTGSAATLTTGRTIGMTGDVTWTSGSFNGSANVTGTATLANSGVTAGTYTKVTVDAKGRVTTGASLASGDLPTYTGTITSGQVTTALGYTPYNSTNPSGYLTDAMRNRGGVAQASIDSATLDGFYTQSNPGDSDGVLVFNAGGSLGPLQMRFKYTGLFEFRNKTDSNSWNSWKTVAHSGNFTSFALSSGQVTTALGYTPYNSTNPSGYITSSSLSSYLPLSGGTLTGTITVGTTGSGSQARALRIVPTGTNPSSFGSYSGSWRSALEIWDNAATRVLFLAPPDGTNFNYSYIKSTDAGLLIDVGSGGGTRALTIEASGVVNAPQGLQSGGNNVITAANIGSYASGSAPLLSALNNYVWSASTLPTGYSQGIQCSFVYSGWQSYGSVMTMNTYSGGGGALQLYVPYSPTYGGTGLQARFGNYDVSSGNSWTSWKTLLASDNYGSYSTFGGKVTSGGNNGFANDVYYGAARNPIWSFGNAPSYGISYYQGAAGVGGGDTIGFSVNGTTSATSNNFAIANGASYVNNNVILHAGNYTSYAPSLGGSGASGTWGINITGSAGSATSAIRLVYNDGPRDLSDRFPNSFTRTVNFDFVGAGTANGTGNYGGVMTYSPWTGTTASTGDSSYQLAFANNSGLNASGQPKLSIRNGIDTTWNAWYTLLHSGNYTSYSPSLTGSGASGTWGINISGSAAQLNGYSSAESGGSVVLRTASNGYLNLSNWIQVASSGLFSSVNGAHWYPNNGSYGAWKADGSRNGWGGIEFPGSTTAVSLMIEPNGDTVGFHAHSYGWKFRVSGGTAYVGKNYWGANEATILDSSNYTSYSPSRTGSGASGTWGINITGNASTVSSLNGAITILSGGGGATFGANHYSMGKDIANGSWSHPHYSDLIIGYHTGIRLGAAYSGIRFYANSPTTDANNDGNGDQGEALLMTVGGYALGGSVNIVNDCYAYGYRGHSNVAGTGQASYHPAGIYSVGTNWLYGTIYMNGNIISGCGNIYLDTNHGNSVVGLYSSYRYQGVFAMGDSYKMSADGTSLANMYGIAWSHPNAGGAAGNLTDHGMLIINNGSFRCAISNSIVASGNITAYSDERLKRNWRDMPENFVERLAQVRVGCYERIDDGTQQVGVSAQSLQPLLPEAIQIAKDEIGTLSVSYGNAAMASAVELAKELVMLKQELAEIKSRLH